MRYFKARYFHARYFSSRFLGGALASAVVDWLITARHRGRR